METASLGCLTNSISRFILLITCQKSKYMPTLEEFEYAATILKHMKPIFDEIDVKKIHSDASLWKECETLDVSVNAAREFVERWLPKMSRILLVLQSEKLLTKVRSTLLEICCLLCRLLRTSSCSSNLADVQVCTEIMRCVQELQSWHPEYISKHIEQAVKGKTNKLVSSNEHLAEIVEFLSLTSTQELLKESIAIEKERVKRDANKCKEDIDQINMVADFLGLVRDYLLETGCFGTLHGIPIPSYFQCPLSLDFMLDPVILASGQTFERSSIQKWLDHGLRICPKTRQYLSHTNIIPNYTVKALIANWFDENNLKLPRNFDSIILNSEPSLSDEFSSQDVNHTDSFHCSLRSCDSVSRSSIEGGDGDGGLKISDLTISGEVSSSTCQNGEAEKSNSYTHSRTQSASSAISSSDYMPSAVTEISRVSDKHEKNDQASGEIMSKSLTSPDSVYDETTTSTHVEELIEALKNPLSESQSVAAGELRFLAKHNMENRILIGKCGAIGPLVSLLYSNVKMTQEHSVTALLNLSLNEENKVKIANAGVIEPLIHVLKTGTNTAKENSAATLFSLSVLEEYKAKIGRSGAIKALVDLLAGGTVRGIKDAATALFNLSICHENKARIVQAGAVKHLVQLLEPSKGMVDKSVALLANLSTISEGRSTIAREDGIPLIVEIVDTGSQRGKENAASILLQLCINSTKLCNLVLREGAVPPLVALSQSGTPRAKEKAQQLLSHFRNQREGATGKKKK